MTALQCFVNCQLQLNIVHLFIIRISGVATMYGTYPNLESTPSYKTVTDHLSLPGINFKFESTPW